MDLWCRKMGLIPLATCKGGACLLSFLQHRLLEKIDLPSEQQQQQQQLRNGWGPGLWGCGTCLFAIKILLSWILQVKKY